MKRVIETLAKYNLFLDRFVPDGKFYLHNECFYYIGFQDYSDKGGEPFYTVLFGAFGDDAIEYCTLENPSIIDMMKVKKRMKRAYKLLAEYEPVQEKEPLDSKLFIRALGFKEKDYFYTSSNNQQIVNMGRFTEVDFFDLMPKDYWESKFPGAGAQAIDWHSARSSLMSEARQRGIFQPKKIRGAGVWNDEGRVVINMGDHLLVDGIKTVLGEIRSKYFYTLGTALPSLHSDSLSADECVKLTDACHGFKWKKKDYGFLLAGALVTTRICGALPIRPHIWLTGAKEAGKTTLFNRLIYPVIGNPLLFVAGNSTEAGIRQSLRADAIPVLFDEFENNGNKSAEIIQSVLDLMRIAWSETDAVVLKGSSSGNAESYQIRFAALVTSIRQISMGDADKSRFATLELAPHGNDQEHWKILDNALNQIDMEYGNRLFARTIKMLPVLLANYKVMKRALTKRSGGQRFGDQYGMLLAGYAILLQDEPMDESQAQFIVDQIGLEEEKDDSKVMDHEDCLGQMLTKKVMIEVSGQRRDYTIGEAIVMAHRPFKPGGIDPDIHTECIRISDALQRLGIKVQSEGVAIASKHSQLEADVFRGTRWSNSWAGSLIRIQGAERKTLRFMGTLHKCAIVPGSSFWG